jgi:predicted pore-forming effector associated with SMODS systems
MTHVGPDIRKVAVVSAVLFLSLYSIMLLILGNTWQTLLGSALRSGGLLAALGVFWAFYNKWGWRWRLLRFGGWLCAVPDLNGRWEGTVCRHIGDEPHPFVMEITQTFSTLSFQTFSTHSRGESLVAAICVNETKTVFSVVSFWRTHTRRLDDRTIEDTFDGASFWQISLDANSKQIEDFYFTKREPPTKGTLKLTWKSWTRLNRFQP